jgi:ferrochelatase
MGDMGDAVVLVSHGSIDDMADLAPFLTNVRRGQPPTPELVAEMLKRYEAIGGRSPLNAINAEVARKLGARLGIRVAWASRLWKPTVREVVGELAGAGVRRVGLVPLAQHSAKVYADDARRAVDGLGVDLVSASNWGQTPPLVQAFARRLVEALGAEELDRTAVVLTAHSLPRAVIDAGDPYEREVRSAADAVLSVVREKVGRAVRAVVAFQSQGLSAGPGGSPVAWLGPTLEASVQELAARGDRRVVFAPTGFLADHVEILYDLDVEMRALAGRLGMAYARTASLNADDDFVDVLADVARPLLRDVA